MWGLIVSIPDLCPFSNFLYGANVIGFISYLSCQLHCCALPDKRCLSHGMLPLSGHDDVALLNDVANDAESTQKSKNYVIVASFESSTMG